MAFSFCLNTFQNRNALLQDLNSDDNSSSGFLKVTVRGSPRVTRHQTTEVFEILGQEMTQLKNFNLEIKWQHYEQINLPVDALSTFIGERKGTLASITLSMKGRFSLTGTADEFEMFFSRLAESKLRYFRIELDSHFTIANLFRFEDSISTEPWFFMMFLPALGRISTLESLEVDACVPHHSPSAIQDLGAICAYDFNCHPKLALYLSVTVITEALAQAICGIESNVSLLHLRLHSTRFGCLTSGELDTLLSINKTIRWLDITMCLLDFKDLLPILQSREKLKYLENLCCDVGISQPDILQDGRRFAQALSSVHLDHLQLIFVLSIAETECVRTSCEILRFVLNGLAKNRFLESLRLSVRLWSSENEDEMTDPCISSILAGSQDTLEEFDEAMEIENSTWLTEMSLGVNDIEIPLETMKFYWTNLSWRSKTDAAIDQQRLMDAMVQHIDDPKITFALIRTTMWHWF